MLLDYSKYGYVYKTTNKINNKIYIGLHRIKTEEDWFHYLGSGTAISRAIRKYGKKSFLKELLYYADSEEQLFALENKAINEAVITNKNLYNILHAKSETLTKRTISKLSDYNILDLFFEDKLSTTEIADIINVSQPAVQAYLSSFRDKDKRFENVKQGVSLGGNKLKGKKISDTRKAKMSATLKSFAKVTCDLCNEEFSTGGSMETHRKACEIRGGSSWPNCLFCGCRLSKRSSKYCFDHKYERKRL